MKRIILIACAKKKKPHRAKAQDLYDSPLFGLMLAYARALAYDKTFILSAKQVLPHFA
jgi:hypothetical protein